MSYRVTLWNSDDAPNAPKHYMSRAQAIHGMRKLAYDKLAAFGKLDTTAAHDVMQSIDRCDDIIPPQGSRSVMLSNTGCTLTISNTALQR